MRRPSQISRKSRRGVVQPRQDEASTSPILETAPDTKTRTAGRPTKRDVVLASFDEKYPRATPEDFARRGRYVQIAIELIDELGLDEQKGTVARWISQHLRGREADKL